VLWDGPLIENTRSNPECVVGCGLLIENTKSNPKKQFLKKDLSN
jgi:hypothetical protein